MPCNCGGDSKPPFGPDDVVFQAGATFNLIIPVEALPPLDHAKFGRLYILPNNQVFMLGFDSLRWLEFAFANTPPVIEGIKR